jgi:hypothetical protein
MFWICAGSVEDDEPVDIVETSIMTTHKACGSQENRRVGGKVRKERE